MTPKRRNAITYVVLLLICAACTHSRCPIVQMGYQKDAMTTGGNLIIGTGPFAVCNCSGKVVEQDLTDAQYLTLQVGDTINCNY